MRTFYSDAVGSAWHSLVTAIKQPVKIRRLGRLRKRKRTTPAIKASTDSDHQAWLLSTPGKSVPSVQLVLPILMEPDWNAWRNLMPLDLNYKRQEQKTAHSWKYEHLTAQVTPQEESNNFGVLYFV
ncbi:unnamed protein product [Leptidea sinapis]|uniref:Uncharacterized protein n=1 Tax=Leptidea sinapis TaxID=189913 RepID=A0A5E4PNN2_9NEOP|nr:unnamed protein product [Leptidea sinapis]